MFRRFRQRLNAARHRIPAHPDQVFGNTTYAQFGEDIFFLNLFGLLGVSCPTYLDVGAHHPHNISNTALLYERGSRGINVEANPHLIGAFRRHRRGDINLNVGVGPERGNLDFYFIDDWSGRNTFDREAAEGFVRESPAFRIRKVETLPVVTLQDIVDEHAHGRFPHLLTIDAEGLDAAILKNTSFEASRPLVVCVEALAGGDDDSSAELMELLGNKGYVLYVRTVGNLIFVCKDAAGKLRLPHTRQ